MTTAVNTFGDRRIDRLAGDYLAARESWHYRRETPASVLNLDGRLTREAMQGRYVVATIRLAEALMLAGDGACWDDGNTILKAGEKRSVIVAASSDEEAP